MVNVWENVILIATIVPVAISGLILLRIRQKARHGDEAAIEFLRTKLLFSDDFPNELKPYVEENWRKYGGGQGAVLLKRYLESRENQGDWFLLDRFLAEEKQRINRVDAKRLSTRLMKRLGITHRANN